MGHLLKLKLNLINVTWSILEYGVPYTFCTSPNCPTKAKPKLSLNDCRPLGNGAEAYHYGTQLSMMSVGAMLGILAAAYIFLPVFHQLNITSTNEVSCVFTNSNHVPNEAFLYTFHLVMVIAHKDLTILSLLPSTSTAGSNRASCVCCWQGSAS